jgi:hopanoid C-3 methylase
LNKYGIDCYASVIAMPEWDVDDFERETKKLIDLKIRFLNIQPLTPLEKTDIIFDENNLIIPRSDYPKWDLAHVVVKPEKLSVKEYYRQVLRMYEKVLFRPGNLFHHFKYPLHMHFKLLSGALKVRKQYRLKIKSVIK